MQVYTYIASPRYEIHVFITYSFIQKEYSQGINVYGIWQYKPFIMKIASCYVHIKVYRAYIHMWHTYIYKVYALQYDTTQYNIIHILIIFIISLFLHCARLNAKH